MHLDTQTIVAIKERKTENESFIEAWEKEIKSLKMIDHYLPDLMTSKIICVLDDSSRSLKDKYIVMEWIEGGKILLLLLLL